MLRTNMLGGYDVVRKLSEGASAEVFLAFKTQTQERVILEVLREELACDDALRTRFIEETKARRELRHPSVARRVAGGQFEDGRVWLCSEPVGESLRQRIASPGPLTVDELIRIALPLCEGLHFLHQKGVVHGNLKPASVFLQQDKTGATRVKLFDYGLALLRTRRAAPVPHSVVLVEAEYLCPERVSGQRATLRSDIYALGVLLYECLAGFPPFTSADPQATRRKHLTDTPPPLPPSCDRIASIINKCLAKEPAHRYGSAEAVRQALSGVVEGTLPLPGAGGGKSAYSLVSEGDVLGPWKLEKLLGEGAMGEVFLSRHLKLGRMAALKVLKPALAADRNHVRRFFQEARAVNQVSHPHIVQIHDFVDDHAADGSRHVYCVMELLEGETLRARMDREPLTLEEILRIASQVAGALDAAHRVGVVHRDLKPDNLFLTVSEGKLSAKVLDFGIAKLASVEDAPALSAQDLNAPAHTMVGHVVGTPAYMSPEQTTGGAVDGRTDIYALGVLLYRVLAGKLPFAQTDFQLLSKQIVSEPPPPMPQKTPAAELIPAELRALVEKCLQKAAEQRYESMAALAETVDLLRARLSLKRTGGNEPIPLTEKKQRFVQARYVAVAAVALLLFTAIAIPAARYSQADPPPAPSTQIVIIEAPTNSLVTKERTNKVRAQQVRTADGVDEQAAVNNVLNLPPPPPLPTGPISLVVNSNPAGAVVFKTGTDEVLGVTPLRTTLPRAQGELKLHIVGERGRHADVTVDLRSDFTANVKLRRSR